MRNWNFETEWPKILNSATTYGIDPFFVASIRVTENGSAGRDFGVLSETAPDYAAQLRITCVSVRNSLLRYGVSAFDYNGRLCYPQGFVEHFRKRWAPSSADNDPSHLNDNWLNNCWTTYLGFADDGGPIAWQLKQGAPS